MLLAALLLQGTRICSMRNFWSRSPKICSAVSVLGPLGYLHENGQRLREDNKATILAKESAVSPSYHFREACDGEA